MTLSDVRIDFIKASLRYDLVASGDISANVDAGANYFLNAGQKFLDVKSRHPKSSRKHMTSIASGEYSLEVKDLLSVERLTFITSEGRRDITSKVKTIQDLRILAPALITDWIPGTPSSWAMNVIGLAPEQKAETSSTFLASGVLDYDDVHFSDDHEWRGILFYPPVDQTYTIELVGKFYSAVLTADATVTYWTEVHPEMLVIAGLYALERTLKNTTAMKDHLNALEPMLQLLDVTEVESELAGIPMDFEDFIL